MEGRVGESDIGKIGWGLGGERKVSIERFRERFGVVSCLEGLLYSRMCFW